MTRDQFFALPVGTQFSSMYVDAGYEAELGEGHKGDKVLLVAVRKESSLAAYLCHELKVIPGELDASEGVE